MAPRRSRRGSASALGSFDLEVRASLIGLSPTSGGALLAAEPQELSFGAVPAGGLWSLELELRNDTPGPEAALLTDLVLSDTTVFGLDVMAGADPCGSVAPCQAPAEWCTVAVTFSSADAGVFNETLVAEGNFEPVSVPLEAVSYVDCPYAENLVLEDTQVEEMATYTACQTIATGPNFAVAASGSATLTAGQSVILGEGTEVVAGGELVLILDQLVAIP